LSSDKRSHLRIGRPIASATVVLVATGSFYVSSQTAGASAARIGIGIGSQMTRARGYPASGNSLDIASSVSGDQTNISCAARQALKARPARATKSQDLRDFPQPSTSAHTSEDDWNVHEQRDATPEQKGNGWYAIFAWRDAGGCVRMMKVRQSGGPHPCQASAPSRGSAAGRLPSC